MFARRICVEFVVCGAIYLYRYTQYIGKVKKRRPDHAASCVLYIWLLRVNSRFHLRSSSTSSRIYLYITYVCSIGILYKDQWICSFSVFICIYNRNGLMYMRGISSLYSKNINAHNDDDVEAFGYHIFVGFFLVYIFCFFRLDFFPPVGWRHERSGNLYKRNTLFGSCIFLFVLVLDARAHWKPEK